MRGPKAAELILSDTEKAELERLVHGHLTPQQLAVRGRMILLAAQGKGNAQIGRELHMCADTIRLWRMRWIGLQAMELADLSVSGRLKDDARPGRPAAHHGGTNVQDCRARLRPTSRTSNESLDRARTR